MQKNNPLHGVTLEMMIIELEAHFGWESLYNLLPVNCFSNNPSMQSCLKFFRKNPWARAKLETIYLNTFSYS